MINNPKPGKNAALVHWNYTREEWRAFMRWRKMKKSFFHYLFQWLLPKRILKIPQVIITRNEVAIDEVYVPFRDDGRRLKRINIRDAGRMNIMEITYEKINGKQARFTDIFLPVPKGKLREAIRLQEELFTGH
jgi:hypothetical protein